MAELPDSKGLGGRPPKITDEQKQELAQEYRQYIQDNDDPTLAGFLSTNEHCFEWEILKHNIDDWTEFSTLKQIAIQKQEANLLRKAGKNEYNPTLAIFRLKQPQHGYSDRHETDITSGGDKLAPVLVQFMDGKSADDSETDTD